MAEVKVENSDEEVAEINKSAEYLPRKRPNSIDSDQSGERTSSPDLSDQPLDCHIKPPPAHQPRFTHLPRRIASFAVRGGSNTCKFCKKTFNCGSLLRVHLRVHTGERPFVCNVCNRAFSQSGSLKRHKLIHVEDSSTANSVDGLYSCNICEKQLTSASGLERHLMLHLNYKPYGCNVCGKRFTNSSVLMAHRRVHTGEKPYKCEVCHKTFTQNGTLKRHKMVHTGEKPFACNLCDWRGTQLFLLMQHKRSHHFGEKPYSCTICHKTFSFSSSLQLHQRTHTGEKPYKCEYCSKSFTQNGSLNRHKLNNHNIMTKRQWQNRCFQEQVQVQPENLSSSVFHKIDSHFPPGALPPITGPGRLPESAAGLMLKAAAPNLSPPAFADMSHLTRYMQAYQPHMTRPHPHDFSPTAANHLETWGMSKPGYTETEPISPESSVKHGGDSTPSRQSVQSPASISETQAAADRESPSAANKDHPMESPVYSKDMPMNYEHGSPTEYSRPGGPSPMGVDYSDKKDHDRPNVMYLPHEYVNDIGPNSSRPGSNSDKFNSSQSAESGYLSPQTNTDTDDNSTVHESHSTAVVRTVSSFPRITDPIKRLGHKSRSGSREKLTLDQTISRLSGRASVEDRTSRFSMGQVSMEDQTITQVSGRSSVDSTAGSITTPVSESLPTTAIMSPTRVGSPKALNTFSVDELLNNLYTRGKVHYCEHCQVFFIDAAMYFIHRGTHDPHQPYKCSLCSYTARDRYDFSSHFLEHK